MGLSNQGITDSANAAVQVANLMKQAYHLAKEYSQYNSVTDPGWQNLQTNPSGPVDPTTKIIAGTQNQPGDISAAIGSMNEFISFWEGQAVTTSAWGQNIEKIAKPIV